LKEALKGCDGLFHVAASYSFWSPDPKETYRINLDGTLNIIEAAIACGIERIVYTSSESTLKSFNGKNDYVLNEVDDVAGDYKKSKLLAEKEVVKLIDDGMPIIIINPTTPIGSRDIKPTPTGKIVLDMLNGRMPAFVNTGLNIIDVEDVAKGHILAFENSDIGKRYLLGNENLTLKEILVLIANIAGLNPPNTQIPLGVAKTFAYIDEFISGKLLRRHPRIPLAAVKTASKFRFFDCTEPVKELGLQLTPIELSFKKSIDWFRENDYIDRARQKN
jgi:dihydroflavonol-4-reductase